jgi:DNA-3-methyladenine glycosylase I
MMIDYHDHEWGTPVHDDALLFEHLTLDCMQAGLSWITILHKREAFREAFDDFDPVKVAKFDEGKVEQLLSDRSIVRNRLKIEAAINNARRLLEVQAERGSFDSFIWGFVGGETLHNRRASFQEVPASTPESVAMSKSLRERGFKFVGPTICYAFMQAVGMVNDHLVYCFRHEELRSGPGPHPKRRKVR